jgi:FtsH-binding integral membrane protein
MVQQKGYNAYFTCERKESRIPADSFLVLQIVTTDVCNSARTVCKSVASLSSPSKAVVEVKNVGVLTGSFTVSLGSCTYPIVAVSSQSVVLAASATTGVVFEVLSCTKL